MNLYNFCSYDSRSTFNTPDIDSDFVSSALRIKKESKMCIGEREGFSDMLFE
jgi:hypothetical protein